MREITPTHPLPSLADAVKRLRLVQMAWNNLTHSRHELNTWEAFEVVLAHCESGSPLPTPAPSRPTREELAKAIAKETAGHDVPGDAFERGWLSDDPDALWMRLAAFRAADAVLAWFGPNGAPTGPAGRPTDAERLDWIERELATVHCNFTHPDDWSVTLHPEPGVAKFDKQYCGTELRDAIDRAMQSDAARSLDPTETKP